MAHCLSIIALGAAAGVLLGVAAVYGVLMFGPDSLVAF